MKHYQRLMGIWLGISSLVSWNIAKADPVAEAEALITQAEAARHKAATVSSEWRDTADMLKKANAALTAGDFATAKQLAMEAKYQGELGYTQGSKQQHLQFPDYLR